MHIFVEIGLILAVATAVSFLMRLLKQPLIVGYILSGVLVGPYALNLITTVEYIDLFAKLGIAILLFVVGLSLRPDVIREVGRVSLVTGLGQIIFTSILGFGLMKLLGFSNTASLYAAIALTFSSTIIILKLLSDKGDLEKLYGKISIGFLLVQDVIATLILLIVSFWGSAALHTWDKALLTLAQGFLFFTLLYLAGRYVLPKLSGFLAKSQEALFLFSITWGLGVAAVFYTYGFSLEIGALAAGVALSVSPFAPEIGSRLKPLRDFFILLFFVMLGSHIIISSVSAVILPALILSLFVLVGNPIIVIILMNLLGYKSRTGFLAGLTVAQISEFSLILVALGFTYGHLAQEIVSLVTLVGVITIAGSTYLILYGEKIYDWLRPSLGIFEWRKQASTPESETGKTYNMIIVGYDRVGYDFVNIAQKMKNSYLVVDFNPNTIQKLTLTGIPCRFGDASDAVFLEELGLAETSMVISTVPDLKTNLELVTYYRNYNSSGVIIMTSSDIRGARELYARGASFVVMPYYLGARYASKLIETHGAQNMAFEKERQAHLEYLEKRQKHTG